MTVLEMANAMEITGRIEIVTVSFNGIDILTENVFESVEECGVTLGGLTVKNIHAYDDRIVFVVAAEEIIRTGLDEYENEVLLVEDKRKKGYAKYFVVRRHRGIKSEHMGIGSAESLFYKFAEK